MTTGESADYDMLRDARISTEDPYIIQVSGGNGEPYKILALRPGVATLRVDLYGKRDYTTIIVKEVKLSEMDFSPGGISTRPGEEIVILFDDQGGGY